MTGDRSLEEFLHTEGSATGHDGSDDEDLVDEDRVDGEDEGELVVEPAAATHDWSPDGVDCAACGEQATRRWRAGEETVAAEGVPVDDRGAMVCDDCKVW